jgi:archaellum component FlaF (FlaF/FlaG flagellin family)
MKAHWLATAAPFLLLLFVGRPLSAAITERVSVSSSGEQANSSSYPGCVSADGRFVTFTSQASNLMPGDTNGVYDVFVHDRLTGATERVSVSSAGEQGNEQSLGGPISADGRFVAFSSLATNLVPGDTNGAYDVFLHDHLTGATERVSVSSAGEEGNHESGGGSISADGRFVAFGSSASNLVSGDTNDGWDAFVHDRLTGATERVSVSSAGEQGNNWTVGASISGDGRFVAFSSSASNLVPGDTNGVWDIFVHDRLTGATERVSVSSSGEQANALCKGGPTSEDGRYLVVQSIASDLVPGDTNDCVDIFVRDREMGTTERVSVASDGTQSNINSYSASISADGRCVAFNSYASNLVLGDNSGWCDVFVRDRGSGTTERVSVASDGTEGDNDSGTDLSGTSISADGRCVLFASVASNLVPGDTNSAWDIFVRDRGWIGFPDVATGFWAYDEIKACYDANIVKGYADYLYHPGDSVTRDQMAVYIARALVSPSGDAAIPDPEPPPSFSDVPSNHWAYKHIEYAASQNVVKGYDDGTYHPEYEVDRGQMAVYIARAMVAPGGDAAIPDPVPPATFPDVPDTFWAYKQVEYCVGQGVVKGYDDGLYHPEGVVTRDQMAVYIAKAFGLL